MDLKEMLIKNFIKDLKDDNEAEFSKLIIVFSTDKNKIEKMVGITNENKKINLKF